MFGSCFTTLIISNEEMNDIMRIISSGEMTDIMRIIRSLEKSGLLMKGVSETIKNKAKNKKEGF